MKKSTYVTTIKDTENVKFVLSDGLTPDWTHRY